MKGQHSLTLISYGRKNSRTTPCDRCTLEKLNQMVAPRELLIQKLATYELGRDTVIQRGQCKI